MSILTGQTPFVVGKIPVPWEDAELPVAERFLWALSLLPKDVRALLLWGE